MDIPSVKIGKLLPDLLMTVPRSTSKSKPKQTMETATQSKYKFIRAVLT